jgi:hypothetical protein
MLLFYQLSFHVGIITANRVTLSSYASLNPSRISNRLKDLLTCVESLHSSILQALHIGIMPCIEQMCMCVTLRRMVEDGLLR